jgi:hypothetical protein
MPTDGVTFETIGPDGVTSSRVIPRQAILDCPRVIIDARHYRDDLTCMCDVATVCERCGGEGIAPPNEVLPCRDCGGVGLLNWTTSE